MLRFTSVTGTTWNSRAQSKCGARQGRASKSQTNNTNRTFLRVAPISLRKNSTRLSSCRWVGVSQRAVHSL